MGTDTINLSTKPDGYYENRREGMLKYIPGSARTTLEFGCAQGGFSALIREKLGAETWAVELDAQAAAEASQRLDRVIHRDAAQALDEIPDRYFDCIIFLDILEHMVDPYSLLRHVSRKLTGDGVIVASIPNARYYRNYIEFAIKGNWDYTEAGTLDKTHLRFFTYNSICKMFEQLGFDILTLEGINPTRNRKLRFVNLLFCNALADLKYLQFVVVARPVTP